MTAGLIGRPVVNVSLARYQFSLFPALVSGYRHPAMLDRSYHVDTFARDNLPPAELWPVFEDHSPVPVRYPKQLNAAVELLDRTVEHGHGSRCCIRTREDTWSYERLLETANRIAAFLVDGLGLVPGNRVLLRSTNNPMLSACWLAVLKAGGVVVTTMPLLRSQELSYILEKAQVQIALCEERLTDELLLAAQSRPEVRLVKMCTDHAEGLEARIRQTRSDFSNVVTSHDDVSLIAFTSGTTGAAKATMHFHRDILAIADCFPGAVLDPHPDDVFAGSAPFAFTFGLGAMLIFPMRFAASSVLLPRATAESMLEAIAHSRVTRLFTVPTLYRTMLPQVSRHDISSLRTCISSGEYLPPDVYHGWREATGLSLMNSIGSTEMLHAFVAMPRDAVRPGSVGKPLPAFRADVVDDMMNPLPPGQIGNLAVRGPTGCRYLDDVARQKQYVRDGWNLTGDTFARDEQGYFQYHSRTDDLIVSAGYNISGAEIEDVLLRHPVVRECAVVGVPDAARGQIVAAYIVLTETELTPEEAIRQLQEFVKSSVAPYKYPRRISFLSSLPRTDSGKIQRRALRDRPS